MNNALLHLSSQFQKLYQTYLQEIVLNFQFSY